MANLSLTTTELRKVLRFVSLTTAAIGLVVAAVRHYVFDADEQSAWLAGLSTAIGYAVTLGMYLLGLPWRSARLARWTGRPLVQGVWFGALTSDYRDEAGQPRKDIKIAFVIRQTYLGYSIVSHTKLQDSESLVESLEVDRKHGNVRLRYVYQFQIMENHERKLTMGAAELKLVDDGKRLRGHYMTNSPTRGTAELQFVQRSVRGIDTFESAERVYLSRFAEPSITNNQATISEEILSATTTTPLEPGPISPKESQREN